MQKFAAEFIGTFTLVFLGCGAAVIAGAHIGFGGIAFAFGLSLVAMAYGVGAISGCHINPAVSFSAWIAGRLSTGDMILYWAGQVAGAISGAFILYMIASGKAGYSLAENGLGQNGWGAGYNGEYTMTAAFLFETVATLLFVVTIHGSTHMRAHGAIAGMAIGFALVAIHLVGIDITGVSVNPARSIGPALFVGGDAMAQLWLFIAAPMLGGALGGLLFRIGLLELRD